MLYVMPAGAVYDLELFFHLSVSLVISCASALTVWDGANRLTRV